MIPRVIKESPQKQFKHAHHHRSFQSFKKTTELYSLTKELALVINTRDSYYLLPSAKKTIQDYLQTWHTEIPFRGCWSELTGKTHDEVVKCISSALDTGSIILGAILESGSVVGVFSKIGFISGFSYVTDSSCCGFVITGKDVFVFELGNKMISYTRDCISFGKYQEDFTINLSEPEKSYILRNNTLLPHGCSNVNFTGVTNIILCNSDISA